MVYFYAGCLLLAAAILPFLELFLLPLSIYSAGHGILWLSFKQVSLESQGFVVVSGGAEELIPYEEVRSVSGGSIFGPPHITLKLNMSHQSRRIRFLPEPSQGNIFGRHSKLRRQLQNLISPA
jgi:hypothetical protein